MFAVLYATTNAFALDLNVELYTNKYTWKVTPNIIVCKDSPVTVQRVEAAAQAWREKGIKLGVVRMQTRPDQCKKEYEHSEYGEIIVTCKKRFLDSDEYNGFTTKYHPQNEGLIVVSAIVEINKETIKEKPWYAHKLLIHELGHAIGYGHSSFTKNDVMKPSLTDVH